MKTLRITYKNGNVLEKQVLDWEVEDGKLYFSTNEGFMAHPCVVSTEHMVSIEEVQKGTEQ